MFLHAYQFVLLPIFAEAFSQEVTKMSTTTAADDTTKAAQPSMSPEEQVKRAAAVCLSYWCQANGNWSEAKSELPNEVHKHCSVVVLIDGDRAHHEGGATFSFSNKKKNDKHNHQQQELPKIISVKVLPVGSQNAAAVHVSISYPTSRSSSSDENAITIIHGWLTLLKSHPPATDKTSGHWACISAAFSNAPTQILPSHFSEATNMVWDGYCKANRACDGAAMAEVFHPTCRLTYTRDKAEDEGSTNNAINEEKSKDENDRHDSIVVCPQTQFCAKVQHRYTPSESNMHAPYTELQSHPHIGRHDAILAVEFVTQNVWLRFGWDIRHVCGRTC